MSHSSFQQQFAQQNVDIPVPSARLRLRGDLQGFLTGQSSTVPLDAPQQQFQGFFFALFPGPEKVRGSLGSPELGAHSRSSTLSAHHKARGGDALQGSVPGRSSAALLGGLHGVLPGQSSTRGVRLSDAAARWQAQDPGSEFWPKRACKFFLQGGCQQGQACTFAHSVYRMHPDAAWEEVTQLFHAGDKGA